MCYLIVSRMQKSDLPYWQSEVGDRGTIKSDDLLIGPQPRVHEMPKLLTTSDDQIVKRQSIAYELQRNHTTSMQILSAVVFMQH